MAPILLLTGHMILSSSVSKTRKKAVWGRNALIALFLASFAVVSVPASADSSNGKTSTKKSAAGSQKPKRLKHLKLDRRTE